MKNVLIASFDMEVGGVERSLISMLENLDYQRYDVELMLYRHQGDFLDLISDKANLLPEIPQYTTFRKSIAQTIRDREFGIGLSRIFSKISANLIGSIKGINEPGYYQMQLMWKYAMPFLPKLNKKYNIAISYLWPHYFIADKVEANTKIAWIHTDYSSVAADIEMDLRMWNKFDYIVAVSQECRNAFLKKYSELEDKVIVIENITSPDFIRKMSYQDVEETITKDQRFKIITVARLSYAKGIDNAVRALKILKDKGYENIVWYVIGYGGDEPIIRGLITENGLEKSFILLGKKTNPYPYMKACDLYVQPSRYEGKAVTVTEAKILGKPVVITNYNTARSQVQDGFDGYICELSIEGLARGIEELLNDYSLRRELENNCQRIDYTNHAELEKLYELTS